MDHFRVVVSSVFPSDLMAVLIAGTCMRGLKIELEINESFDLGSKSHRQYVSRAALPLLRWKFCEDGIWRQEFVPIDGLEAQELIEALHNTIKNYQDSFRVDHTVRSEFGSILDHIVKDLMHPSDSSDQSSWARATSILLTRTFNSYGIQAETHTGFSEARREGLRLCDFQCLCDHLHTEMSRNAMRQGFLSFGGHVVLQERGAENFQRLDGIKLNERELVLFGAGGEYTASSLAERIAKSEISLFLRGPVQMVLSKPAIHLPWYAKGSFVEKDADDVDGVEFVSPMVVYDEQRSHSGGESALRLAPTGYSLVEYSSPCVAAAFSSLLGSEVSLEDLEDWRDIVLAFPASREKLSKRQGRLVVPLISMLRRRARCALDQAQKLDEFHIHPSQIYSIPITLLGYRMISIIELLRFLSDCSNLHSPRDLGQIKVGDLCELGILDRNGTVRMELFSDLFAVLFHRIRQSLRAWGISEQALQSRFSSCLEELKSASCIEISTEEKSEIPKPLRKALKNTDLYTQHLLEEYYKFASFFCASVMKAHPLIFCSTHTVSNGAGVLRELVRQRGDTPFRAFRLEVVDDN